MKQSIKMASIVFIGCAPGRTALRVTPASLEPYYTSECNSAEAFCPAMLDGNSLGPSLEAILLV